MEGGLLPSGQTERLSGEQGPLEQGERGGASLTQRPDHQISHEEVN